MSETRDSLEEMYPRAYTWPEIWTHSVSSAGESQLSIASLQNAFNNIRDQYINGVFENTPQIPTGESMRSDEENDEDDMEEHEREPEYAEEDDDGPDFAPGPVLPPSTKLIPTPEQDKIFIQYAESLFKGIAANEQKIKTACIRTSNRLSKLMRERDAFGFKMDKFKSIPEQVGKFSFCYQDIIREIKFNGTVLECYTKEINIPFEVAAIGKTVDVPVGEFKVTITPVSSVPGDIPDKLSLSMTNLTKEKQGIYDHPHVKAGNPCWGDMATSILILERDWRFLELLDCGLGLLMSHNASNAWYNLLQGWAEYMPEETRVCSMCILPVKEVTVSGRVIKCKCNAVRIPAPTLSQASISRDPLATFLATSTPGQIVSNDPAMSFTVEYTNPPF